MCFGESGEKQLVDQSRCLRCKHSSSPMARSQTLSQCSRVAERGRALLHSHVEDCWLGGSGPHPVVNSWVAIALSYTSENRQNSPNAELEEVPYTSVGPSQAQFNLHPLLSHQMSASDRSEQLLLLLNLDAARQFKTPLLPHLFSPNTLFFPHQTPSKNYDKTLLSPLG